MTETFGSEVVDPYLRSGGVIDETVVETLTKAIYIRRY